MRLFFASPHEDGHPRRCGRVSDACCRSGDTSSEDSTFVGRQRFQGCFSSNAPETHRTQASALPPRLAGKYCGPAQTPSAGSFQTRLRVLGLASPMHPTRHHRCSRWSSGNLGPRELASFETASATQVVKDVRSKVCSLGSLSPVKTHRSKIDGWSKRVDATPTPTRHRFTSPSHSAECAFQRTRRESPATLETTAPPVKGSSAASSADD